VLYPGEKRGSLTGNYNSDCLFPQKGEVILLQALTGPEDSRRLRIPDFKTIGNEGGKVVRPTNRPPLPQEIFLVFICVGG
jgi:hypothetical protein